MTRDTGAAISIDLVTGLLTGLPPTADCCPLPRAACGYPVAVDTGDRALEDAIGELLDRRAPGATICPSEAARRVDPGGWRDLMPHARRVAGRLVADGRVEMTQGGEVVDPSTARGPVRLRRPHA
jgi:hypothetical protein